jgi:asparagine N-glycosylation enzyme membrane subunit Stt3
MEALRARRVFATMDKTAQLVLTSGDRLMGARFDNAGALTLNALYSNASGHNASLVQIYEGVPGRNGTATVAATTATATLNPTLGLHYYYAKITQDDGKLLWSAPVWVRQIDPSDVVFRDGFGAP